ncbi:recombinase family protein [Salmonella enterica]|nr:recombinase family protein [Salmonella enterica]
MTSYAYMRVSTDKQETASQATWLAQYDVDYSNVYTDEGKSGKSFKGREGWLTLATLLKRGDTLYVYDMDRISRDLIDQLTVMRDLIERQGVTIITHEGSKAYGMYEQMKAVFAQEQRKYISDRTKAGLQAAKAKGKQIGQPHDEALYERIRKLKAEGLNVSDIAKAAGCSRPTVYKALK